MTPKQAAQAAAVARFVITLAAGFLVAKGRIEAPTTAQIESLAGAVAGVLGAVSLVWSLLHKSHVDHAITTALDMPSGSTKKDLQVVLDAEKKEK